MLFAAAVFAIVTQDQTALRASPSNKAPRSAILGQGEALEVRGTRAGYLHVYDYHRERGGYVLEGQARQYPPDSTKASSVLETVRFLRDLPGFEGLGIGHVALYLKLAPPREIGSEVFDALGTMADRLARRASSRSSTPGEGLARLLDVAQGYGLVFVTLDTEGGTRTCYDGDAFRRVLQLGPTQEEAARAALGLTRPGCETGTVGELRAVHEWAAETLDRMSLDSVSPVLRQRVRLRRAVLWSTLAFDRARAGRQSESEAAAARALKELALVERAELPEADLDAYTEAAVRVAVAKSGVEEVPTVATRRLSLQLAPKPSGETCLTLATTPKAGSTSLVERCTFGQVWPASARVAPRGTALAVAVQPLASWLELWVFHRSEGAWVVDVLSPSSDPDLGYVEWAGWSPDGSRLLLAREARVAGRFTRSFDLIRLDTMAVERRADRPADLTPFHRWSSPDWRGRTLALR